MSAWAIGRIGGAAARAELALPDECADPDPARPGRVPVSARQLPRKRAAIPWARGMMCREMTAHRGILLDKLISPRRAIAELVRDAVKSCYGVVGIGSTVRDGCRPDCRVPGIVSRSRYR